MEWIKFSEHKPEPYKMVLIWSYHPHDYAQKNMTHMLAYYDPRYKYFELEEHRCYECNEEDVSHWMPLPQAPQD